MKTWYIPSWCGDFRLEEDGEKACRLLVSDPTPVEIDQLGKFLVAARKKDWCSSMSGVAERGESILTLKVSVEKAGLLLLTRGEKAGLKKRKAILTAVKSEGGKVVAIAGGAALTESIEKIKDAKEAATVKRPTPSCPTPVSGPDIRASEVLRAFSTTQQWRDWLDHGFVIAHGGLTGHPYRICHRHSDLAKKQGKITWDLHDDHVLHCYDWSVPPAEEVLAVKLVLEHQEHWLRNRSGYWNGPQSEVFHNPFRSETEQSLDGTEDTAILTALGGFAHDMLPILGGM